MGIVGSWAVEREYPHENLWLLIWGGVLWYDIVLRGV